MLKELFLEYLKNLDEKEFQNIPIAKKLEVMYNNPEIKLTNKGNLPIKIVDELVNTGLYIGKPETIKEDYFFEIKLFKNLLIDSKLFRKSKDKLLPTKKYQKLSLKEKVIKLFESLEIGVVLESVFSLEWYVGDSFREFFWKLTNLEEFFAFAIVSIKKEKKLIENVLLSVLYEFGLLKDDKLVIDVEIEQLQMDGIIEVDDIDEKTAKLFLKAILENGECEGCSKEDMETIIKIYNTLANFAYMEADDESFYLDWLKKMAKYIKRHIGLKEINLLFSAINEVSEKVQKDILQILTIYPSLHQLKKKEKEDFFMLFTMTLCEIFLNINYDLFED
jgi:hypothetical protein